MVSPALKFGCRSLKRSWNYYYSVRGAKCSSSKVLEPPWRILFFGNDSFAMESLKPLNAKLNTGTLIEALGVVTGKRSIVRKFSEQEKLDIHEWPVAPETIKDKYHVGLVVSFGHMIPKEIIDAFPFCDSTSAMFNQGKMKFLKTLKKNPDLVNYLEHYMDPTAQVEQLVNAGENFLVAFYGGNEFIRGGCINVHSSILPKYRGAAPIIHAVMNGDSETGVTIMKIHPYRFDVGEIVRQYRLSISPTETSVELEARLASCGGQLVMECLRDLPKSLRLAVKQPSQGVSYAPKVNPNMALVDWQKMDALQIYNLHRAIGHLYPLKTTWHGYPIKLAEIHVENVKKFSHDPTNEDNVADSAHRRKSALDFLNDAKPRDCARNELNSGHIEYSRNEKVIKVTCTDGANLMIRKLIVNGKAISSLDFFNGYLTKRSRTEWKFGL